MRCFWAPTLVLLFASACDDNLNVGSTDLVFADDGGMQGPPDASVERIDQIAMDLNGDWASTVVLPPAGTVLNLSLRLVPSGPRSGMWVLRCTNVMGQSCSDGNGPPGGPRDAGNLAPFPLLEFLTQLWTGEQIDGNYWVHSLSGSKARGVLLNSIGLGLAFEYDTTRDALDWFGLPFSRGSSSRGSAKPP